MSDSTEQKIIVALFLVLGKALERIPLRDRDIRVTESEIRKAWVEQKSPVRLVSREDNYWMLGERTYRCVLGELDLKKTGMDMSVKMPEPPKATDPNRKTRVFDFTIED